jgi:O-glycosyl hydrolase
VQGEDCKKTLSRFHNLNQKRESTVKSLLRKKFLRFAGLFFFSILAAKSSSAQGTPAITTQPTNQTVTVGQSATFNVVIANGPCRSFWYINGAGYFGSFASTISYTIPNTTLAMNGSTVSVDLYSCGSTGANLGNSQTAILTVNPATGAPTITAQPVNQTVTAGQTPTFTVAASGTGPLSYQWLKNGANISGAATPSYTTPATTTADSGSTFQGVVTNSAGSATSSAAMLTVNAAAVAPTVTAQPTNQTVSGGQTATFTVVTSGSAPLSYQWQKNGANISGATSSSYTTPAATNADNGSTFKVAVSNVAGSVTSSAATLTVNTTSGAPVITQQPQSQTVQAGQSATFTVVISNGPCHSFWYINGAGSYGTVGSTISYTIPNTTLAMNGWTVSVDLYSCGSTGANLGNSQTAILTVTSTTGTPAITSQPANQTVTVGQTPTFAVAAGGTAPLSYQWQKNSANISGATSASYTTPATTSSDSGSTYQAVVSNSVGSVTSSAATLTVNGGSGGGLTLAIDATTTYQTIDGFGVATAFYGGNVWTTQECNLLYSRTSGIGLSLLRFKIEENGSYPYMANINCAYNNGARIWGTPWSAPASMKSNGSIDNGGSLLAADYQAWANQLAKYIQTMQTPNGVASGQAAIPIYALSVQNEPDLSTSYESMLYSSAEFDSFVGSNLCPAMQAAGLGNVKIMMPEQSQGGAFNLAAASNADPTSNNCTSIWGNHGYNQSTPGTPSVTVGAWQHVWETEDSNLYGDIDTVGDALSWSLTVHNYLAVGYNAWHYWWGVNDGGCSSTNGQGLLNDCGNGTVQIPWRYYYFGQYSSFVRPGMMRISATNSSGRCASANGVCVDAFTGPDNGQNKIVIVAQAQAGTAQLFTVTLNGLSVSTVTPYLSDGGLNKITAQTPIAVTGNSFTYTLCADCIVTFVGND